ncbi:MAG: DNA internalization-related competence protein ComEC/Rec2 [Phascolarctobacterium sp.]
MALFALLAALVVKKELARKIALVSFLTFLGLLSGLRVGSSATEALQPYYGKQVLLAGRVEPMSIKSNAEYTSIILQCEQLQQAQQLVAYKGRVRLSLRNKQRDDLRNLGRVVVEGRLEPLVSLRNPGSFNSELYNRINHIGGRLGKAQMVSTDAEALSMLTWQYWQDKAAWWNVDLRQRLTLAMGKRVGALLGSMLLGGGSAVDDEMREVFAANGLSHLLSVSGTHVVLLASLLMLLLKPLPRPIGRLLLLLILAFYAVLCGLRPPVLRALIMSIVLLLGKGRASDEVENTKFSSFYERAEKGYLLCLVAVILLLVKPLWLLDSGFQLSFGATAGLLWLAPACAKIFPQSWPDDIGKGVSITMSAQLATLPILVANFHQISLISVVSNLILVPVLELAVLLSLLGTLLLSTPLDLLSSVGQGLASLAAFFVEQVLYQGKVLSMFSYGQLIIGSLPAWCSIVYYGLLLVWADLPWVQFWRNQERSCFMTFASFCLVGMLLWQQYATQPLQVYFLDVGQGDSVVIKTSQQKIIVYDTGGLANLDTGKRILAPFLRCLGKKSVDVLILSHYDYDHVGGAVGLLQQLKVREIVLPQEALDASSLALYETITKTAQARGALIRQAQQEQRWLLGDNAELSLLVPAVAVADANAEDSREPAGNAASTIAMLHSPQGSLLLTGDLGSEEEKSLVIGHFTVFKAGHHGSRNSNSAELLQHVKPEIAVISCGKNNTYGHPHRETLARLEYVGSRVLRTDELGCIKLAFDETGIKCYSYTCNRFTAVE